LKASVPFSKASRTDIAMGSPLWVSGQNAPALSRLGLTGPRVFASPAAVGR
jgi:hypothetical protein